MTAEERATEAYRMLYGCVQDTLLMQTWAHSIREAIAEERERCAKLVDLAATASSSDSDGIRFYITGHDCSPWGCADLHHLADSLRAWS